MQPTIGYPLKNGAAAFWASFLVLTVTARVASGMDMCALCLPGPDSRPPQDLTGLSLQELYDLDVVQPNVLGGHTHPAGQAMFGYEYMHTRMTGYYEGTHELSPAQIFAKGFGAIHTAMDMDMHMFDAMYAPTERLTLMAMLPYKDMTMNHLTATGATFTQRASGIGDLEVTALTTIYGDILKGGNRLILN